MRDDDGVLPLHGVPPSKDVRDLTEAPCCCICGRIIKAPAWLCYECERECGLSGSWTNWPEWVRFLKNDEYNRRYLLHDSMESQIEFVHHEDESCDDDANE